MIHLVLTGVSTAKTIHVSFVLTNDVDLMSNPKGRGGLDKVLGVVRAERAVQGKHVLFIHAGDALSPSLMSRFDQGKHIVELLNLEAPDIFVPGNHEFDFGETIFRQRLSEMQFPVLAANLDHPDGLPSAITASRLVKVDDITIGFVGGIEEDAAELSNVGQFTLGPVLPRIKQEANVLRKGGADFVVAVVSTGRTVDRAIVYSHLFDLVLSGDDHDLVIFYDGVTMHAESASQGDYVNIVDVAFNIKEGNRGRRVRWHPNFRVVDTENVEPHPAAAQLIKTLNAGLSAELDHVIMTLPFELETTKALVRTKETAMGNLIADATRVATGADIGMVNSGSIRGNKVYPAGYDLTYRDILNELPFNNTTVMIRIDGRTLLQALENSVRDLENKAGRFMQVSGLQFQYDQQAKPGSRVRQVTINGHPLGLDKQYTLAINNYVLGGGDGFDMFGDALVLIDRNSGDKVSSQVIHYLQNNANLPLNVFDRINPIEEK